MKCGSDRNRLADCSKATASVGLDVLNRELVAGYKAMAVEDRKTAARRLGCGVESLGTAGQTTAVNRALRISLAMD